MRIGMLTGGGDCPGLNAVIRAVVHKGVLHYGDEFIGWCARSRPWMVSGCARERSHGNSRATEPAAGPRDPRRPWACPTERPKSSGGSPIIRQPTDNADGGQAHLDDLSD